MSGIWRVPKFTAVYHLEMILFEVLDLANEWQQLSDPDIERIQSDL